MQLFCDATGFPLLEWPEGRLQVALLPVTKWQFEQFLSEPNDFTDDWYETELLARNPRISWRRFAPEEHERLFLTGILPEEALEFLRWLGPDYDLLTVEEWRAVHQWLMNLPVGSTLSPPTDLHPSALAIWQQIVRRRKPYVWGEIAMLQDGLLEWVRVGRREFGGLGVPRREFLPNTFNPQRDAPLRPLQDQRSKYVGFRFVRRLFGDRVE